MPLPTPPSAPSKETVMTSQPATPATPAEQADPAAPSAEAGRPSFTVLPLRFTEDAPAMISFLRTLGMAPAVTAGADAFGRLVAGAGHVMVHAVSGAATGARGGDTDLCLAVEETDQAADALRADGCSVDVWDETYGRQGLLTGPAGETVALNEHQDDLYGYRGHDPSGADPRLSVTAVLSSEDFARDTAWAARLGFRAGGTDGAEAADDRWFRALRGPGAAGTIGLHRPAEGDRRSRSTGTEFGHAMQVGLGFETTEDLAELAARLRAAGHPAALVEDGAVRSVHVTDPDGRHLEIHPRPGR